MNNACFFTRLVRLATMATTVRPLADGGRGANRARSIPLGTSSSMPGGTRSRKSDAVASLLATSFEQ